jgi:hypothetical protein
MPNRPFPSQHAQTVVGADDHEPERRLWAVVLACAVEDGVLGAWAAGEDQGLDRGSQDWTRCRCGGGCFRLVCQWAGLEPELVRDRARRAG